jgi:hypothetical protein
MSINIKNREAEELLAELKRRTGRGTTDLLLDLLRKEKARVDERQRAEMAAGLESAKTLQDAWRSLPALDPRPLDEVIDYDENGLPR